MLMCGMCFEREIHLYVVSAHEFFLYSFLLIAQAIGILVRYHHLSTVQIYILTSYLRSSKQEYSFCPFSISHTSLV